MRTKRSFWQKCDKFAALALIALAACESRSDGGDGRDFGPPRLLEEDIRTPDNRAGAELATLTGRPLSPTQEHLAGGWRLQGSDICSVEFHSGGGLTVADGCPATLSGAVLWAVQEDRPYQIQLLDQRLAAVWRGGLMAEDELSGRLAVGTRIDFVRARPAEH